jgi:UDPglucose--hexose-1-phosphate uridylyltransferase
MRVGTHPLDLMPSAWQDGTDDSLHDREPLMDLTCHLLTAEMMDASTGELTATPVEVRSDPLTGHTSRILLARGLMPPNDFNLEAFAHENEAHCPFCPQRIEEQTPRLPPSLKIGERIRQGEAVLFPNLHAYSSHSCVSVYSPRRHYLPLEQMTQRLMGDNLRTQVAYAMAVIASDPASAWASVNANHMLPAGSSLFHPHLQGIVDSEPTTLQRQLAEVPESRLAEYLRLERDAGERYLGDTGRVEWLVSFAPIGPAELRAFIARAASPAELDDDLIEELGHGLSVALTTYAKMGFESFNLAIYGAPPGTFGYRLNLRLVARSNLRSFYRSDSTFLERLHWEGAVDVAPEYVADFFGDRLRR